jgi:endogenous inhibitor of DNA gyrase (YacG/DUF329 family)
MPTIPCPTCHKPVEWSPDAKWRPFCSERCRLIDLGAWMNEQRSIPGEDAPSADDAPFGTPSAADAMPLRRH